MPRSYRTPDEMYPLVAQFLSSSLTQSDFCSRHDLPISVLRYWLRRHRSEEPSGFVEVRPESPPAEKAHVEILYPGGVRVRLFSPVTPAYVSALVGSPE